MGKFNKSNHLTEREPESESASNQTKLNMVPFVKSSACLPGTITEEKDNSTPSKSFETEMNGADTVKVKDSSKGRLKIYKLFNKIFV